MQPPVPQTHAQPLELSCLYNEDYYRSHLGHLPYNRSNVGLVEFFAIMADQIVRSLQPRHVLDAGCAMGFLVEAFWDRGIQAQGIDISPYAIANVRPDMSSYCRVGSLTDPIESTYDLVTCIEVLEHLSKDDALQAIRNLTGITNTILFSSTPTDFEEPTHINVQQPIWWLEQFQAVGFEPDLVYDASYITPHAMLLRKTDGHLNWSVLRLYAELLRFKNAVVTRSRELRDLQSAHSELNATENGSIIALTARLDELRRSLDEQSGSTSKAHALASEAFDKQSVLTREWEQLKQNASELISTDHKGLAAKLTTVQAEVQTLRGLIEQDHDASAKALHDLQERHSLLIREWERLSRERAKLPAEGLQSSRMHESLLRRLQDLTESHKSLQAAVASTTSQVQDIVNSRVWQTLTKAGGMLLRLVSRG